MNIKISTISKGGKKPHAHLLPMMVLVLLGMIALVGVAAADNYYHGVAPETNLSGTVYGGVNVLFNNTWSTSNYSTDSASAVFDLTDGCSYDPSTDNLDFARLYVVVYSGNMTANYEGTEDIDLNGTVLADDQWLNLDYNREGSIVYNNSVTSPFVSLSRVTSDYLNIFNVKDAIGSKKHIKVNVSSTIQSGKYDGRIKEIKLVYGWNPKAYKYWINEGQDPVTKYDTLGGNDTYFYGTGEPEVYDATLWVDYLGNTTSGNYTWNGRELTINRIDGGTYSGYGKATWNDESGYSLNAAGNTLHYDRNFVDWYKLIVTVFVLDP